MLIVVSWYFRHWMGLLR